MLLAISRRIGIRFSGTRRGRKANYQGVIMSNIIEITDFSASELDIYARLTEAQLRNRQDPEKGLFIAESPKVVGYALDAGCEPVSMLMERRQIDGPARSIIARCPLIPIYTGDDALLARLTGFALTRGILCAMRRPKLPDVRTLCDPTRRVAVLDGIGDPANVGAIFRSAAALGMDAVLVASNCCDPLYRRSVRVSMGTLFQIPWTRVDASEWPRLLKEMGFKTAAMALTDDALRVDDPGLMSESRLAIALGSEGNGLSAQTIAACDCAVRIPMSHGVDSLNVAAASALAFWQLGKRPPA